MTTAYVWQKKIFKQRICMSKIIEYHQVNPRYPVKCASTMLETLTSRLELFMLDEFLTRCDKKKKCIKKIMPSRKWRSFPFHIKRVNRPRHNEKCHDCPKPQKMLSHCIKYLYENMLNYHNKKKHLSNIVMHNYHESLPELTRVMMSRHSADQKVIWTHFGNIRRERDSKMSESRQHAPGIERCTVNAKIHLCDGLR